MEPVASAWGLGFTRTDTEWHILSSVLQSETQFRKWVTRLPVETFSAPWVMAAWRGCQRAPADNPDAIITAIRREIERMEAAFGGVSWTRIEQWLERVIPFNPTPSLTHHHVGALLEYNRRDRLCDTCEQAKRMLRRGGSRADALAIICEAANG